MYIYIYIYMCIYIYTYKTTLRVIRRLWGGRGGGTKDPKRIHKGISKGFTKEPTKGFTKGFTTRIKILPRVPLEGIFSSRRQAPRVESVPVNLLHGLVPHQRMTPPRLSWTSYSAQEGIRTPELARLLLERVDPLPPIDPSSSPQTHTQTQEWLQTNERNNNNNNDGYRQTNGTATTIITMVTNRRTEEQQQQRW